ncbi:OLC1v1004028C1 [Oldenlandia corymbosa var. corymbosa]|uniref:OLC1v1004028C1 n=1 Tax=Oldenlandia corymbosa var. corymbosa TaxID=529605 RepID=A0AAV1DCK9_OLDCO|nr:OLC1v1004028C1 [Oldenlandia corymbosa var. corymbosa]
MGRNSLLLLLALLVAFCALSATTVGGGYVDQYEGGGGGGGDMEPEEGGGGEEGGDSPRGNSKFLLQDSTRVVRTDAGEMKVLRGGVHRFWRNPMHIGLITMEPNSLFIPQYLDSSLILFIRRGEARIGHIQSDELVERTLKTGDVYRIASGSAFYLVNNAEGQRLHVICSIDTSDNYGWQWNRQGFQSFFVGGGLNPTSVLSGFDHMTLSTAFNVSTNELREIFTSQHQGPIVHLSGSRAPGVWAKFLELKEHQRLAQLKRIVHLEEDSKQDDDEEEEKQPTWSIRKFLKSIIGDENRDRGDKRGKGPDAYNIYDMKPDFSNNYGWTKAVSEHDYSPLRHSDIGIFLVNLTAGSMLAPHINPRATEYGVVLSGSGTIQIVYPNGTLAMNARVSEGDAFWIPRYFPFCQIASRTGSFEFFGFSTSARNNRPQFLVGANSLLQNMAGPEFAAAFGVNEDRLRKIVDAQRESTILPSASVAPPDNKLEKAKRVLDNVIRSYGNDMIMGFD